MADQSGATLAGSQADRGGWVTASWAFLLLTVVYNVVEGFIAVGNRLTKNSASYTYDAADQMTDAGGVTYGYDDNGNQTSRGSDTFSYDHENRLTGAVMNGVSFSSVYNGDGLRMSHTEGAVTTSFTWDVAAGLPVVLQDDANTYVYGLDLISTTDGAGVQTYHLYDGLGSTSDLTDGSANPTDAYSYDVFGEVRSRSGSSPNYWLFTGEQQDGQPATPGGVQRLPLDVVVSSTNVTGATVDNLDDDPDSPDGNWATATTVADTSIQTGFPTPQNDPTPGADLQEFRVLLRKDAAGGNDPTYDIELWESGGGSPLATLVSGATLSSDTGEVVSATWDASLLGTADGSAVEVRIVGHRSGGNPTKRRTVEVGAIEWNADYQGTPSSELYFLRARYYDPQTGRFLGQDPLGAGHPYGYAGNNPVNYVDPTGLCHVTTGLYDQICGRLADHKEGGFETTTGFFEAEWTVLTNIAGSGEAHENLEFRLWARVTSSRFGSRTYFNVSREGSDAVIVSHGVVHYEKGDPIETELTGCADLPSCKGWLGGSDEIIQGRTSGQPTKIELNLAPNLTAGQGRFISSSTLSLDLQTGETGQNHCAPPGLARLLFQNVCK